MSEETAVRFRGVAPYLYYEDAGKALEWLTRVLGFRERVRYVDPDGVVQEAEMTVGEATIHMSGAGTGYWERNGPQARSGTWSSCMSTTSTLTMPAPRLPVPTPTRPRISPTAPACTT